MDHQRYSEQKSFEALERVASRDIRDSRMSNFTDREDRDLVQLAKDYEDHQSRVCWAVVAGKMKYSKKCARVLRQRLTTLKITHGKLLREFPAWYFVPARRNATSARALHTNVRKCALLPKPAVCSTPVPTPVVVPSLLSQSRPLTFDLETFNELMSARHNDAASIDTANDGLCESLAIPDKPAPSTTFRLSCDVSHDAVASIFAAVKRSDVRQLPGRADQNVGEVSLLGITDMLEICRFMDVGSGVDKANDGLCESLAIPDKPAPSTTFRLSCDVSHDAVASIFAAVKRSDVRQLPGRADQNVGEVSPLGITDMIEICRFTCQDVFLDVGSGVGNVVTQIALQSYVKDAIGVEMRSDVAALGKRLLRKAQETSFPQLARVRIIVRDIRDMVEDVAPIAHATVLFSSNILFSPSSNLAIHRVCCMLPSLRLLLLAAPACPRHSSRCINEFCAIWKLDESVVEINSEFRKAKVRLYVYGRKFSVSP